MLLHLYLQKKYEFQIQQTKKKIWVNFVLVFEWMEKHDDEKKYENSNEK